MSQLVKINFNSPIYEGLPAANGVGDTNAIRTGWNTEGQSGYNYLNVGGRVTGFGTMTLANDSSRQTPQMNLLEGYASNPQDPYFDIWLSGDSTNVGPNLSQGSLRFLISLPAPQFANTGIVMGLQTGTAKWALSAYNGGGWGFQGAVNGTGNPSGVYRVEVQWDTSRTPSIIARLYPGNGTTQFSSPVYFTPSSNGAAVNVLRFGDWAAAGGGITWGFSEFEAWDTYNADGLFTGTWGTGSGEMAHSSYAGARNTTTYSIPAPYSTPSDSVAASYTSFTDQGYGNYSRNFNLYIPNGTPRRPEGFPLVMWAHSGFFAAGDKSDLIAHWRNRLLNAGYAVASINYVTSTLTASAYSAYGTSNTDSGNVPRYGRYPSFIVDFKLAAVRLRDKYSQTGSSPSLNGSGYGFDASKIFATGYSAGGYIALGAAVTRGMTNDGSSRDLTIAGNSSYNVMETSSSYTGADPAFIGSFVYAAPISLKTAMDWDWAHNLTNAALWPPSYPSGSPAIQANAGPIHIAARAFMGTAVGAADPSGTSFTNTDITNLISQQNSAKPYYLNIPVGYTRGTADYLVHSAHETLLASAVSGTQISYSSYTSPANHTRIDEVYNPNDIINWLDSVAYPTYVPTAVIY